jgi:hypothetical protein
MNIKYIGMDIHKETISIAVMNGEGKVVMESIIETKASTILQCIQGIHGDTTVRLNVEENQLVNVFGEFCVCVGSLKSA